MRKWNLSGRHVVSLFHCAFISRIVSVSCNSWKWSYISKVSTFIVVFSPLCVIVIFSPYYVYFLPSLAEASVLLTSCPSWLYWKNNILMLSIKTVFFQHLLFLSRRTITSLQSLKIAAFCRCKFEDNKKSDPFADLYISSKLYHNSGKP